MLSEAVFGVEINVLLLPKIEPRFLGQPARKLVTVFIVLWRYALVNECFILKFP